MQVMGSKRTRIIAGIFAALVCIACCVIAIRWYTEIYQYELARLRPIEPENFVDPGKTTCEVHGEILQVETISRADKIAKPDDAQLYDAQLFPHSNKALPKGCGLASEVAIVQFCGQCRKVEFLVRQREELERDLRAQNLWHELPQH